MLKDTELSGHSHAPLEHSLQLICEFVFYSGLLKFLGVLQRTFY